MQRPLLAIISSGNGATPQIIIGRAARKLLPRTQEKIECPPTTNRERTHSISQLPDELFDAVRRIRKPSSW